MSTITHTDLTQRPPRSPRVRLGGYVILPRMLDKGRATLAGANGPYHFNCPLDQHFLSFAGIDAEKLKAQLALDQSDTEILDWIMANSTTKRSEWEIAHWSAYVELRTPGDVESKEYFIVEQAKLSKIREDILSWFDLLDVDDYASFGGKA